MRSGIFAEMDMEKWVFTWMLQGGWVVMQVFHACERRMDVEFREGKGGGNVNGWLRWGMTEWG